MRNCVSVRWEPFVFLFIIGFLKEDIGTDAGFFQFPVIFHSCRCDIHIHTADRTIFVFDGINGFDTFQHIFDGIVHGIFSRFQCKAFMPHILQCDDFRANLILRQFFAGDMFILKMVGAVQTAVDAIIGKIQRREHHDAVAVNVLFDLFCQRKDLCHFFRDITFQQHQCFPMGETFALGGFCQDRIDQGNIIFVFSGIGDGIQDLAVVDKFFRFGGFGIVLHNHTSFPVLSGTDRFYIDPIQKSDLSG